MESEPTYVAWRAAGEVFGRLNESLGFGDLIMFTRTRDQSNSPTDVAFQWTFNAGEQRHSCEQSVAMIELQYLQSSVAFADHLANRWKNIYRLRRDKVRQSGGLKNMRQTTVDDGDFATARRRVCDDMQKDEGLRIAYQANIAMAIFDNSALSHKSCNLLADHIMHVLFEV